MSVDFTDLLSISRRLVRTRLSGLLRGMPRNERAAILEEQAEDLAYTMAETAQGHLSDVESELSKGVQVVEVRS